MYWILFEIFTKKMFVHFFSFFANRRQFMKNFSFLKSFFNPFLLSNFTVLFVVIESHTALVKYAYLKNNCIKHSADSSEYFFIIQILVININNVLLI